MRIMKQCLDIEQMQHLQELGLDTSNASAEYYRMSKKMDWFLVFGCRSKEELLDTEENIPAYTLQDVLDALPLGITYERYRYLLVIEKYYIRYESDDYHIAVRFGGNNLIDAAYELLCWCIENKFVETNKNE